MQNFFYNSLRKIKQPSKKRAKDLNRHITKEDVQKGHKPPKQCSVLLVLKEMQLKPPWNKSIQPIELLKIQSTFNVGNPKFLYTVMGILTGTTT